MAAPRIQIEGLRELQRALKAFSPAVQKSFRARLRAISRTIARDAQRRASWSRRIPATVRYGATLSSLYVRVKDTADAPHAVLYEGRRSWRHPLFGNREHWYSQAGRPFLRPAVDAHQAEVQAEAARAVELAKQEVEL